MNLAHLHLLLNHWPILGTFIGLGLLLVSIVARSDDLKESSLALLAITALLAIPAYLSGHAAEEAIKQMPGLSRALLQTHQGAALLAFLSMEVTGTLALIGLWQFSRAGKNPRSARPAQWNLPAVLLSAIVTAGLMAIAGNTGGDIRHPEILAGPETTSAAGALGARLTLSIQYFVIDYSRWVWPLLEALHFLGLILLVGAIGVLNLRILGFLKQLPVAPLQRFVPWGIAGFVINVITGFFFFMGMPFFYVFNGYFQLKIFFILVAAANLLLFYCTGAFRTWAQLGSGEEAPRFAKLIAAISIVLWFAIIVLGRYIPLGQGAG